MELLARLPELREPRALPKWLMQVAHHQCYRWKQQQRRTVSRDAEPDLPVPETPAIAESLIQQTQEEQILREATAALTPQCRRLVELLFFETPAPPYAEVARELGLSVGALMIARKLRRKEDLALGLRARANALYACGDNRAAVEHHQKAIELYQSLKIWKEAGRTLSSSIQPLILLGEYDRAFQASERAREIFTQLGEPRRIASLENNVGNIFHRQDRFEEALAHYERAANTLSEYEDSERF